VWKKEWDDEREPLEEEKKRLEYILYDLTIEIDAHKEKVEYEGYL
jgi:hypothetical protein